MQWRAGSPTFWGPQRSRNITDTLTITLGFAPSERETVARLYWQAFGAKLGKILGPTDRALAFFQMVLDPEFALVARGQGGTLLGLAGFKTTDGGLVDGSLGQLAHSYGWFGAFWRALALTPLERELQPGVFQMDGIFVDADARGQGVGTALLNAVRTEAQKRGCKQVQLDVIDTNPKAKALYERVGFYAISTEKTGLLKGLLGFSSATRMALDMKGDAKASPEAQRSGQLR